MKERISAPKWVCATAIMVGIAAFAVQCAIDIYQLTQGVTDRIEWWAQAWQATLPTGLTIVISAFGGCLLFARAWVSAVVLYVFVGLVMAVTASNGIDFLTNSTVAKSVAAQKRMTLASDITAIQVETAKKERQETLDTLWRTYTVTKKTDDKERVLSQIKGVTEAPLPLQAPQVEEVKTGGGMILNRRFGWSPEIVQEVRSVALPILVLIGKSLAITLGFAFWPKVSTDYSGNPPFDTGLTPNLQGPQRPSKTRKEALTFVRDAHPANPDGITASFLADKCNVSRQCAHGWMKQWKEEGHLTLAERKERPGVKPTIYVASVRSATVSKLRA